MSNSRDLAILCLEHHYFAGAGKRMWEAMKGESPGKCQALERGSFFTYSALTPSSNPASPKLILESPYSSLAPPHGRLLAVLNQ